MQENHTESILVLDIGAAFTKAVLFDVVEGQRRFVAKAQVPSTLYPPILEVKQGIVAAVQQLEAIVGRLLLGQRGPLMPEHNEGHGVDACFIVSSVASLLRAIVVGTTGARLARLMPEVAALPGVAVVGSASLDTKLSRGKSHMGQMLDSLRDQHPHVLVVSDGDPAQTAIAQLAQTLIISTDTGGATPSVVFLGTDEGTATLQRTLREHNKLYPVSEASADSTGFTPLQERLRLLWLEIWHRELPGAADLDFWGEVPAAPIQHGFANALRFLAAHGQTDVWGLDIGASMSMAMSVVGGALTSSVRSGIGVGQGSLALLDSAHAVGQWLPFSLAPEDSVLSDAILAKHFHPCLIPETETDLQLEGALAREVARRALDGLPSPLSRPSRPAALLVGGGATLSSSPAVGDTVLLLLDCFQPVGLVDLAMDQLGVLPMLGAVAQQLPEAACELLLRDGLQRLGPCLALGGTAQEGVAVTLTFERGHEKNTAQVSAGEIKVLPLPHDETVKLTVKPAGKLDCGAGPGRKATFNVRGGPLGLVIDARGRPLVPGDLGSRRIDALVAWRRALGE